MHEWRSLIGLLTYLDSDLLTIKENLASENTSLHFHSHLPILIFLQIAIFTLSFLETNVDTLKSGLRFLYIPSAPIMSQNSWRRFHGKVLKDVVCQIQGNTSQFC